MPIRFTNCIRAVAELALPEDMYDLTDEKRVSICVVMHRAQAPLTKSPGECVLF